MVSPFVHQTVASAKMPGHFGKTWYRYSNLYFIRSGEFLKIGLAANIEERLRTFQLGNPHPIRIVTFRPVPLCLARHVEAQVHATLAQYAVGREWFLVDSRVAIGAATIPLREAERKHEEWLKIISTWEPIGTRLIEHS